LLRLPDAPALAITFVQSTAPQTITLTFNDTVMAAAVDIGQFDLNGDGVELLTQFTGNQLVLQSSSWPVDCTGHPWLAQVGFYPDLPESSGTVSA
jgi:hypothetical protein